METKEERKQEVIMDVVLFVICGILAGLAILLMPTKHIIPMSIAFGTAFYVGMIIKRRHLHSASQIFLWAASVLLALLVLMGFYELGGGNTFPAAMQKAYFGLLCGIPVIGLIVVFFKDLNHYRHIS